MGCRRCVKKQIRKSSQENMLRLSWSRVASSNISRCRISFSNVFLIAWARNPYNHCNIRWLRGRGVLLLRCGVNTVWRVHLLHKMYFWFYWLKAILDAQTVICRPNGLYLESVETENSVSCTLTTYVVVLLLWIEQNYGCPWAVMCWPNGLRLHLISVETKNVYTYTVYVHTPILNTQSTNTNKRGALLQANHRGTSRNWWTIQ